MFKTDVIDAISRNGWDGSSKYRTKDCGRKCPWHYKIKKGPRLCLWGVAWKQLCDTKKPRKCELFAGKREPVNGNPTRLRKASIREDIKMGLHSHNRRFRNGVHFHRLMNDRATVKPLRFPKKKIVNPNGIMF